MYDNHAEARAFRDCDLGAVAGPGIKYPAPPDSNFAEREHAVNNVASVSLAIDGFIIVDNNDILAGKDVELIVTTFAQGLPQPFFSGMGAAVGVDVGASVG